VSDMGWKKKKKRKASANQSMGFVWPLGHWMMLGILNAHRRGEVDETQRTRSSLKHLRRLMIATSVD
jgi:hypothetical protein